MQYILSFVVMFEKHKLLEETSMQVVNLDCCLSDYEIFESQEVYAVTVVATHKHITSSLEQIDRRATILTDGKAIKYHEVLVVLMAGRSLDGL